MDNLKNIVKSENEITVSINISKRELVTFLNDNGYKKIDSYIVDDIYFISSDVDLRINPLEILKNSILVRSVDDKKHYLMYKYKEYDENENIINQSNSKVQVVRREDAIIFLKTMGYKDLIRIVDYIEVYEKDALEILVEYVNDKYLFIEIEENDKYNSIESMIKALDDTKIDYDKNNYFVKKAKIIFEENYRNK